MSELIIITPELEPGSGGLADHTLNLLREWRACGPPTILVANGEQAQRSDARVQQLGSTSAAISRQLPATGGRVFVQYSAYGFSRFGYPRALLQALIDWRKRGSDGCLVVMFHEIWAFWPVLNKNFLVQQWHRRSIKQLLGVCDAVFTTTASQAEHLQLLNSAVPVQISPVGSNVRLGRAESTDRKEGLAVLFGLQASRVRALERMHESLTKVAGAGYLKQIATVGHESDRAATAHERELLQGLRLEAGFTQHGALPEAEISKVLSSASFGIFGQNELSCQKSGSFMAYAAHQLRVIADFAGSTKPPPVCWLVAPSELLDGIDAPELDRRAKCLQAWQEENCSWEVIANHLGRALGIHSIESKAPLIKQFETE